MTLDPFWLWVAAVVATTNWCVHVFVGGPRIVPPLLSSELPAMPKYVLHFVWHVATITLLSFPVSYALAALYPSAWPLAVMSTALAALIGIMIAGVAAIRRLPFLVMPQWTLFLAVATFGVLPVWI
jgi:hypothetical protein